MTTAPWPGETWQEAIVLTTLETTDFNSNMSSAAWNPITRTFWVCRNGGPSACWALVEDGAGSFKIATNESGTAARFVSGAGGDFEGICQVDYNEASVYIMTEVVDLIKKYNVSVYGTFTFVREWDVSDYVPAYDGTRGSEGITFVPDEWLTYYNFVDGNGNPYPASVNGMGGLMFVCHQNGGRVYVFDLSPTSSTVTFVGAYKTRRDESADLEFDRSNGHLYIWHNTGDNYLEVTTLSSYVNGERYLTPIAEFLSPKGGNLEGIGILPASDSNNWCLITDDSNQDGAALMWFRSFNPGW